jgi:hypothetical protein
VVVALERSRPGDHRECQRGQRGQHQGARHDNEHDAGRGRAALRTPLDPRWNEQGLGMEILE